MVTERSNTESSGETVVDHTINVLREAIRTSRFVPGQRLIVADITEEFAVSAGPVREAIRRLTGEGLIEIVPHRGASVRRISIADVREIYDLREAIEGMAARLAAKHSGHGDYLRRLTILKDEMTRIVDARDGDRFLDNNRAFHDLIYEMSGNERIRELSIQLTLPIYQLRLPNRMTIDDMHRSYRAHLKIIEAVVAGNAAAAEKAMRAHVSQSGIGLIAAMETAEVARVGRRGRSAGPTKRASA